MANFQFPTTIKNCAVSISGKARVLWIPMDNLFYWIKDTFALFNNK